MKGILLRSHIDWHEYGEQPTKYFCSLEKSKYVNKTVYKIEKDGILITDQTKILPEMAQYYESLYSSKIDTMTMEHEDIFFDENNILKINLEQSDSCEGLITLGEIKEVLKNTKHNKTPGSDGIPMEFYKVFLNDIWPLLIRSMNESFVTGELSITQKQGVITCLPKGQKPKHF